MSFITLNSGRRSIKEKFARVLKKLDNSQDKQNLEDFISDGGKFLIAPLEGGTGSFVPQANKIEIELNELIEADKTENYNKIDMIVVHELCHFADFKKMRENGLSIDEYWLNYDLKSVQKIQSALEISALCRECISFFEAGGKKWDYYKSKFPITSKIFNKLEDNGVEPGTPIPKKFMKFVADAIITDYSVGLDVECGFYTYKSIYHNNYMIKVYENKKKNFFKRQSSLKSINAQKMFEVIGLPTSFTEKQLDALLLISNESLSFSEKIQAKLLSVPKSRIKEKNYKKVVKAVDNKVFAELKKAVAK